MKYLKCNFKILSPSKRKSIYLQNKYKEKKNFWKAYLFFADLLKKFHKMFSINIIFKIAIRIRFFDECSNIVSLTTEIFSKRAFKTVPYTFIFLRACVKVKAKRKFRNSGIRRFLNSYLHSAKKLPFRICWWRKK